MMVKGVIVFKMLWYVFQYHRNERTYCISMTIKPFTIIRNINPKPADRKVGFNRLNYGCYRASVSLSKGLETI